MMIVDAQIHIWAKGTPSAHHRQEPYSADQALWLFAAQNPRFSELRITFHPNSRSAISADPSVEPLSTTMVSKSTPACRASDARQARNNSLRFQFTTTTVINRLC